MKRNNLRKMDDRPSLVKQYLLLAATFSFPNTTSWIPDGFTNDPSPRDCLTQDPCHYPKIAAKVPSPIWYMHPKNTTWIANRTT
jgi:hypothetical protein